MKKETIDQIYAERTQKTLAIAGGKGGVGATSIVVNLGYALAAKMKRKVLAFDASLSMGNVDVFLGIKPKHNLYHVLNGEKEMSEVMVKGPGGMHIIPAPSGIQEMSQLTRNQKLFLAQEFLRLSENFDMVLLDIGSGVSSNATFFCSKAIAVLIVLTPDPASIRDAYGLTKILFEKENINDFKFCINLVADETEAIDTLEQFRIIIKKLSPRISLDYVGYLPISRSLQKVTRQQKIFLESNPRSKLAKYFMDLAKIMGNHPESNSGAKLPGNQGLMQAYKEMVANKINKTFALKLVQEASTKIPEEHYKNVGLVKTHVAQEMVRSLKIGGPIRLKKGATKIVAFVGPTGVGKTTTIAKLAADFSLTKKASVGFITLDNSESTAVEKLKTYAKSLKIPIEVIVNKNQLVETVANLEKKDLILIDTVGQSKKEEAQLNELVNFLGVDLPIEVHLVLSSTWTEENILASYLKFHPISVDRLLFTKLDESVYYGTIYNVVRKTNKPLSYFTTGQKIPEDIELAKAKKLVDLILQLKD